MIQYSQFEFTSQWSPTCKLIQDTQEEHLGECVEIANIITGEEGGAGICWDKVVIETTVIFSEAFASDNHSLTLDKSVC